MELSNNCNAFTRKSGMYELHSRIDGPKQMQRRDFLERSGIGVAGILTGQYAATVRGFATNELVNVGCVGTGARCARGAPYVKPLA
jgi:hypothetical protein